MPPILKTVASRGEGVDELLGAVREHHHYLERTGLLAKRRARRAADELREIVIARLERRAVELFGADEYRELIGDVQARVIDPYTAADQLLGPFGA